MRRNFVWSLKCSIAHLANGVLIISLSQYRRRRRFSICRKTGGTRGARGQAAPCTPRSESGFYSTRFSRSLHLAVFRPSPVANLADTYRGHFRAASGTCAWQVIPDGLTLKRRIVSVCLCAPEDSLVPANPVRTGGPERRAQPSVHCWKQDINVSPGPNVRPSPLPRGSQCQTSARI